MCIKPNIILAGDCCYLEHGSYVLLFLIFKKQLEIGVYRNGRGMALVVIILFVTQALELADLAIKCWMRI